MRRLIFFCIITLLLFSCNSKKKKEYPDVSHIKAEVDIKRLDRFLQDVNSVEEVDSLLAAEPVFAEAFLKASGYPHRKVLSYRFFELLSDPGIDTLFTEVEKTFGDLSDIEKQFESAFKHIKYYYPEFTVPTVKTVVTGILHDMHLSDSLIILGLDYYLGPDGKYTPDIPTYIAERYQKEYMVPQCILLMSTGFNANDRKDQTALADMIFYGKSYYFTRQMIPGISDTLITGYSGKEAREITEHEDIIWAGLLENEALYETSHIIKEKFLGERPKTYEIGENCPGRIGRWVGYRIVSKYMENHPEVTLRQLMANPDAQQIFTESAYRPIDG